MQNSWDDTIARASENQKIGLQIIGFVLWFPHVIWSAYVLMLIWNWHAVPLLGVQRLGIASAIGIDMMVHHFKGISKLSLKAGHQPGDALLMEFSHFSKGLFCLVMAWLAL